MEFNDFQTAISYDISNMYPMEVISDTMDSIDSIVFINRLVSKDIKRACDLPRDSNNKIIVDITNPHRLENMDYFRQPAIHFNEHGCYTNLFRNPNPQSEYSKFWKEEARKCREGVIREEDGEWITGFYYYYLNYAPIVKTVYIGESRRADRTQGLPNVYMGDYLYFHYIEQARNRGEHGCTLKKRGAGYSYKGGAMLARNFILGESEVSRAKIKSFAIADEKEYLVKDGTLNKFVDIIDWCANHTPFPRCRDLKDSYNTMHWVLGYKDRDNKTEKGLKNEVMGVTIKNDPERARGKRGSLILWEETGAMPCFIKAWGVSRKSVEDGDLTFGQMLAFGTGGSEGSDFSGLIDMFYGPKAHNVYGIPNVVSRNANPKALCGFFFGAYMNREGCYDHDGNPDVVKSLLQIHKHRYDIKYGTADPNVLTQAKAEDPITPEEAVLRSGSNCFPESDIKDYLAEIEPNFEKFVSPHSIGRIAMDSKNGIVFQNDPSIYIVREFPIKDNLNKEGGLEIFEHPKKINGEIPWLRYIAGFDPVDDDHSSTTSLCSLFIFDTFTDKIVAEYTGRPQFAEQFYDNTIRILQYYNALCNYENAKKGFFAFCKNHNLLHYLSDTPKCLKDMEMVKGDLYGNKMKGTPGEMHAINAWGRRLQVEWMLTPCTVTDDNENVVSLRNLHKIRSIGYLKECLSWNPDGNFDRVSAMNMVMILRYDLLGTLSSRKEPNPVTLANDEFFKKNFDNRFSKSYRGYEKFMAIK